MLCASLSKVFPSISYEQTPFVSVGQPDNRYDEDCAVVEAEDRDNTWRDVDCEWYHEYPFVCRKPVGGETSGNGC